MSYSHSSVGHAMAQCKHREGSRMSARVPYGEASISQNFSLLSTGFSYGTCVVRHVMNHSTNQHELWCTPAYYSMSTNRHVGYFRAGFITKYSSDNIFITVAAVNGVSARSNPSFAETVLERVSEDFLPTIDKPRLREATRRGTIVSCIHRIDAARRNMTQGIPASHIDTDVLKGLDDMSHFLDMLTDTSDIEEVRAAVRAHQTLNSTRNA